MLGWCQGDTGWGGWVAMTLTMVVFWAVVLVAAVVIWRGTRTGRPPASDRRDARDVLDERFARGEIDELEYQERRDALDSKVH